MKTARKYFQEKYPDLDEKHMMEDALTLFKTMRGSYVVGQTMHYGICKMLEVEPNLREKSNIADAFLMLSLFFPFADIAAVEGEEVE